MKRYRKEALILLCGDLFFLLASLWLALFLRSLSIPTKELFLTHLTPFAILFLAWVTFFYIAGLYEKHTLLLKSKLPGTLLNTQLANSALAVVFFYLVPFFGITPKTVLFIYLLISSITILFWRMYGYFLLGSKEPEQAILVGSGSEMQELLEEVNGNPLHGLRFASSVDLDRADELGFWDEIVSRIYAENIGIIAIDLKHEKVEPVLPHLYNLIFSGVRFIDMHKIYEDIFDRVPLSLLRYSWFLENISARPRVAYDTMKRLMDIILSLPLLAISLVTYPFIALATKLEDGGPVFIAQERVGHNNRLIRLVKFRSMSRNEIDPTKKSDNAVTRTGAFIRKTRLDEFPQLWSVFLGRQSLIGPRPELPSLVKLYEAEIPYYNVRHIIKPGLSGWAQIKQENHPHHAQAVTETKEKLAYDLYYIKNRSFLLDLKIALHTVRTLLSRVGA